MSDLLQIETMSNLIWMFCLLLLPISSQSSESTLSPNAKFGATENSDNAEPAAFYDNLDTLKYIAIGALVVLICCCIALIIFVRRQVRQTEEGTEIQKYIRKQKEMAQAPQKPLHPSKQSEEAQTTDPTQSALHKMPSNPPKIMYDRSLTAMNTSNSAHHFGLQSNTKSVDSAHTKRSNLQQQIGCVPSATSTATANQSSVYKAAIDIKQTPGVLLEDETENDVKKELYLVKIAQQNEMKERFENMEIEQRYEDHRDEDEDFGNHLNHAIAFQQSHEDAIFNDIASDQFHRKVQTVHSNKNNKIKTQRRGMYRSQPFN